VKSRNHFYESEKSLMARKKTVEDMSSDELYALAEARAEEEVERQREEARLVLEELRGKRRELVAKQRKELAVVDREIRKLTGKTKNKAGRRGGVNVTERVMQIVVNAGEISTKDIKAELENEGLNVSNLSQTLAYLKRQGKVTSPTRSIYTPA
jgi:hypothetical protein